MPEITGYCVKCKAKRKMENVKLVQMKNKRWAFKGQCPVCGTGMYVIAGLEKPDLDTYKQAKSKAKKPKKAKKTKTKTKSKAKSKSKAKPKTKAKSKAKRKSKK